MVRAVTTAFRLGAFVDRGTSMQCGDWLWFGGDAACSCVGVMSMSQLDRRSYFSLSLSSAHVDVPIQPAQVFFRFFRVVVLLLLVVALSRLSSF
jgi:hypothetical protein